MEDIYLPSGTKVAINPFVTNRDFGMFENDANDFNPDHWLNESSEDFETRLPRMKDTVDFVFGGGGRICMGRYLAMLEIMKLIAALYSMFDVGDFLGSLKWMLGANSQHGFNW